MFRQIIKPETKEDLIIHLPEECLGTEVKIESSPKKNATKKKTTKKKTAKRIKSRAQRVKEMFALFDKHLVSTKGFKFDREEANARR